MPIHLHVQRTDTDGQTDNNMGMDKQTRTISEYCSHTGQKSDSVLKALRRTYGGSWSLLSTVPDDFRRDKKQSIAHTLTAAAPAQMVGAANAGQDWRGLAFQSVCVLIALAHAVLIWYDMATLWIMPGKIAGGLAFLMVVATLIVCTDKRQIEVSENMVWLAWLIDGAAGFIHYKTFWYSNRVKGGLGVTEVETVACAAFICLFSAAAIYFFRQSIIKE